MRRRFEGRAPSLGPWAILLVATITFAGCGEQGPARYRVHGSITHRGKPVPLGRIVFEPDVLKGNRGPQGFAVIENGFYDTAVKHGRGTSGGAMVITIEGFDPSGSPADANAIRTLFKGHQEHRDLPAAAVELSIDVPEGTSP